jgi:hypothetical protein
MHMHDYHCKMMDNMPEWMEGAEGEAAKQAFLTALHRPHLSSAAPAAAAWSASAMTGPTTSCSARDAKPVSFEQGNVLGRLCIAVGGAAGAQISEQGDQVMGVLCVTPPVQAL